MEIWRNGIVKVHLRELLSIFELSQFKLQIWDVNGNLENSGELAAFVMGFRGSQWCERHFSEAPERDWGPHAGGEIQHSLLVHLRYLPKEHVLAGWPSFCLVYLPVIRSDIEHGWKLICPWKILTLMIFHGYVNLLEGTWCFWKSRNCRNLVTKPQSSMIRLRLCTQQSRWPSTIRDFGHRLIFPPAGLSLWLVCQPDFLVWWTWFWVIVCYWVYHTNPSQSASKSNTVRWGFVDHLLSWLISLSGSPFNPNKGSTSSCDCPCMPDSSGFMNIPC